MIQFKNQSNTNLTIENKNSNKVIKPPYLLGLLGFIPLVGFFVGVFLFFFGILKYKDKKLTFIGIGCILFTILIYSTLYYVGFVSDFGKKGWDKNAEMALTTLVKHIEFFKLENGKYPDNLKQIESKNEFIFIVDPTQKADKDNPKYFNYKNLGEKYLLFSPGNDGIPNTKDDIYPIIKTNNKIGWIKSNYR